MPRSMAQRTLPKHASPSRAVRHGASAELWQPAEMRSRHRGPTVRQGSGSISSTTGALKSLEQSPDLMNTWAHASQESAPWSRTLTSSLNLTSSSSSSSVSSPATPSPGRGATREHVASKAPLQSFLARHPATSGRPLNDPWKAARPEGPASASQPPAARSVAAHASQLIVSGGACGSAASAQSAPISVRQSWSPHPAKAGSSSLIKGSMSPLDTASQRPKC
mmetsp:Transcript_73475/g.206318  ORF Transcript_73475/g.206318 Transcript_73475/m.206318 type:complete len:222 (+) Transcript_73475:502-1167(+)